MKKITSAGDRAGTETRTWRRGDIGDGRDEEGGTKNGERRRGDEEGRTNKGGQIRGDE